MREIETFWPQATTGGNSPAMHAGDAGNLAADRKQTCPKKIPNNCQVFLNLKELFHPWDRIRRSHPDNL
jgi:hypothetical protein